MEISNWLRELGLERYTEAFRDHDVDAKILAKLTADDLTAIGVTSVGHRRRLLEAIAALTAGPAATEPAAAVSASESEDARPRKSEAERRQLTVLFCDLVGSTALAARLDPEDMGAVIRAYQGCCTEVVERWGGHVAKYMGDGVLAYFGWPQAHEDEAERAVRAGLAIVDGLAALETPVGKALVARIGIATGLVMVGELIGEGAAKEQTVVGETPNLAARLQALAAPGSVVISQATRRLVGGLFELADLGRRRLKGFAKPVRAWRVEGEGRVEGRFEALHGEQLTPLVGREHEISLLLDRCRPGERRRRPGRPALGRTRDRQVAHRTRASRATRWRAVHAGEPLLLAASFQQPALPGDRSSGAGRRVCAGRSVRAETGETRSAVGPVDGRSRRGGATPGGAPLDPT